MELGGAAWTAMGCQSQAMPPCLMAARPTASLLSKGSTTRSPRCCCAPTCRDISPARGIADARATATLAQPLTPKANSGLLRPDLDPNVPNNQLENSVHEYQVTEALSIDELRNVLSRNAAAGWEVVEVMNVPQRPSLAQIGELRFIVVSKRLKKG
jgi:hypothetical protein